MVFNLALIITKKEAEIVLKSLPGDLMISLDLGKSLSNIKIKENSAVIGTEEIGFDELKKIKEGACYAVENSSIKKIAFFSEDTNFYYKLVPTQDWPTFTLSSTPMHMHTKTSPKRNAESIVGLADIRNCYVLDTCCGLGYTAIISSKKAKKVFTFEKDKNVLAIAMVNPYSNE